jgi:hypothetical protein
MPSDDDGKPDLVVPTTFFPRRRIDDFDGGGSTVAGRRTEDGSLLQVTDSKTGLTVVRRGGMDIGIRGRRGGRL